MVNRIGPKKIGPQIGPKIRAEKMSDMVGYGRIWSAELIFISIFKWVKWGIWFNVVLFFVFVEI